MSTKKQFSNALGVITADYEDDQAEPVGKNLRDEQPDPDDSVQALSPLSNTEASRLAEQETRIEHALRGFADIGQSLEIIRSEKLYRATHKTWDSYTKNRWDVTSQRAYQLIDAGKVVADIVKSIGPGRSAVAVGIAADAGADGLIQPTIVKNKKPAKLDRSGQPQDVEFTEGEDTQPSDAGNDELPPGNSQDDGLGQATSETIEPPRIESHAAALVGVEPADRGAVWEGVVAESRETGKPITAAKVRQAAAKKTGDPAVPLNKKAPKDRKARKTGAEDEGNDLDGSTLDLTRSAMKMPNKPFVWSDSGDDEPVNTPGFDEDDSSIAPGSREAHIVEMGKAMRSEPPAFGEVMITVTGSWLMRAGVAEQWRRLRGDDRPVDDDYKETISLSEANEMKLLAILARL